jgi:SAM-dependent methyltransferase
MIVNDQVMEIYEKHVLINNTDEYRNRYVPLPLHMNNKNWKWESKDFPRVISLLEFNRFISVNNLFFKKALCINGSDDPENEYINCEQKIMVNYGDDTVNHDLHQLTIQETDFDFIMLNQTIEHLYNPLQCLENLYGYMKPGGIIYASVPVLNGPHDVPYYYYTGMQPVGLGVLMKLAGFEIISIGQWGNLEYINILFGVPWWADYQMMKNPGLNEFNRAVTTWIFARKEK